MRVNGKRFVLVLMALLLVMPLVAACGGGDDSDDETPETSAEQTTETAATAEPDDETPDADTDGTATGETDAPDAATPGGDEATETTGTPDTTGSIAPNQTAMYPLDFVHGFNVFPRGDEGGTDFNQQTIGAVQDAGFGWVRVQFYWKDIQREPEWWDPLPVDRIVDQYAASGVKVMASISNPPEWALDPSGQQLLADWGTWETFVTFMADRYKGKVAAWEIWNEPNHAVTVNGTVRVTDFANLLERGYTAVKAVDPRALVVFGGLTPTGVNDPSVAINDLDYLRSFYELEGGRYAGFFDVMGMHGNATNNAPDLMYPDNPGTGDWSQDPSFYFKRVEQLRGVMQEFGDGRPVWITEFGWTTANQAPGYEYGADITEDLQAQYLVRAFEIAKTDWDWVTGMFVWNLNFSTITDPADEKYPWSVLNADWTPRPAYEALKAMPK